MQVDAGGGRAEMEEDRGYCGEKAIDIAKGQRKHAWVPCEEKHKGVENGRQAKRKVSSKLLNFCPQAVRKVRLINNAFLIFYDNFQFYLELLNYV